MYCGFLITPVKKERNARVLLAVCLADAMWERVFCMCEWMQVGGWQPYQGTEKGDIACRIGQASERRKRETKPIFPLLGRGGQACQKKRKDKTRTVP
jgi:hypothetical protein